MAGQRIDIMELRQLIQSSGLYIVRIHAIGHTGKSFNQSIKLMLVK